MIITLKDGSKKEYSEAKSIIDIAYDISEGLARAACAGEVNGEVVDLRTVLDSDCELNILTAKDEKGLAVLRHTASHVLAQAVQNLYPEAKVAIGPSIDTGFYYDFDHEPFSREDLDTIEKEMKKIIKKRRKDRTFHQIQRRCDRILQREKRTLQSRTDRRSSGRCRNLLLFTGRLDRPLCRTAPDERKTCQSIQTSFFFQRILERQREKRYADTYLRNSIRYKG